MVALESRGAPVWCLTGTPVQNKADDLFSLLECIGVAPFKGPLAFRVWSDQISRKLTAKTASHTEYNHGKYVSSFDIGTRNLRTTVGVVTLRRHKQMMVTDPVTKQKRPLIELPPKVIRVVKIRFSVEEQKVYDTYS